MLNRQYKLIDHKLDIIGKFWYRKNQMKKSGYAIVVFLLLLADKYAKCQFDITVDVREKWSNKFWDYEHLGYAYGNYDSYLYKLKTGYKCYRVTYGNTVIWTSVGNERADRVVLSGRGITRKVVEIDLDNEEVVYFYKGGLLRGWERFDKDI